MKFALAAVAALSSAAPPTVHRSAVYGVNITQQVVYGQGLYCTGAAAANFSQGSCSAVDLTLAVLRPTALPSSTTALDAAGHRAVPLPDGPLPVLLAVHGGSYTHGGAADEFANAEYFVRRGWLGLSVSYRLCNGGVSTEGVPIDIPLGGNLVCAEYGSFPAAAPFGNASCPAGTAAVGAAGTQGLLAPGCALDSPPKNGSFFGTLMSWMYPAVRDAKAAVRWARAHAASLGADADHITAIGGSAGACSVVGLATTFESDYKNELSAAQDATLASTHLGESSAIATGLVQWGGDYVPIYAQQRDPDARSRYTAASAPLATYHGSDDGVISPKQETTLAAGYVEHGVPYERHVLAGCGHDADACNVTLPDGTNQTQHDNMFEFVTRIQKLAVVP